MDKDTSEVLFTNETAFCFIGEINTSDTTDSSGYTGDGEKIPGLEWNNRIDVEVESTNSAKNFSAARQWRVRKELMQQKMFK